MLFYFSFFVQLEILTQRAQGLVSVWAWKKIEVVLSRRQRQREREYVRRDTHKMLCEKSFGDCCCVSCAGGRCCCCTLCFWFTHFFHSSCSYKSFLCVAILFIVHSKILLHFLYFIALKPMRWWLTRSLHTHAVFVYISEEQRKRMCDFISRRLIELCISVLYKTAMHVWCAPKNFAVNFQCVIFLASFALCFFMNTFFLLDDSPFFSFHLCFSFAFVVCSAAVLFSFI